MLSTESDQIRRIEFQFGMRVKRLDVMDIEILSRSACHAVWILRDVVPPHSDPSRGSIGVEDLDIDRFKSLVCWLWWNRSAALDPRTDREQDR